MSQNEGPNPEPVAELRDVVKAIGCEAAALLVGVNKSQISRWVRCENQPKGKSTERIAKGLALYNRLQIGQNNE